MIVFQSVMMTFVKSSLFVTQLRLSQPEEDALVFVEANA